LSSKGWPHKEKKEKPGGTGVSPVQSFKITRGTLPHWQEPGSVYFITWRCKKDEVLSPEERTITLKSLQYWDGRKWTLIRTSQNFRAKKVKLFPTGRARLVRVFGSYFGGAPASQKRNRLPNQEHLDDDI
jgi:hypothetical protein